MTNHDFLAARKAAAIYQGPLSTYLLRAVDHCEAADSSRVALRQALQRLVDTWRHPPANDVGLFDYVKLIEAAEALLAHEPLAAESLLAQGQET